MRRRFGRMAVTALMAVVGATGLTAPVASAAVAPPKSIVVTATPSTAVFSQAVKLTASITPRGGGAPKGGTVTFLDGETPVGTATATTRDTTVTTTALGVGSHTIRASYSGDAVAGPATSAPVTVTVGAAPTSTTLRSGGPVTVGERSELKATVLAAAPAATSRRPAGTVTFTRGSTQATVALNANGVATWRPLLPVGDHPVTASYDGNGSYAPSGPTGATLTVEDDTPAPQPVIDQQSSTNPQLYGTADLDDNSTGLRMRAAQVVTPHITGDLTAIGFDASTTGQDPLKISIQTVVDDIPSGTVIGTATLPQKLNPGMADVTLDNPVPVVAGTPYAIVFSVDEDEVDTNETIWSLLMVSGAEGEGNGYADVFFGGNDWLVWDEIDLAYRTWVLPAAD